MANNRPLSSGHESSSASTIGSPPLMAVNKGEALPEEWLLPKEWNMEKREPFENWKMDVQSQIANIARTLDFSLRHHPHPEVGARFDYSDKVVPVQMEKHNRQNLPGAGNTLLYGMAWVPNPM